MGMFDSYQNLNPDYIPNNEHKCIPCKCNHIVAGGTSTLVFELPIQYKEDLQKVSIVFNQEARLIVVKSPTEMNFGEHDIFVTCKLDSLESREFGHTYLDTQVQLKLEYPTKTLFTEITKIKVIDVLDDASITPL